jgi:hypothetical protein
MHWAWMQDVENHALFTGRLHTVFGWRLNAGPEPNCRTLRNFPHQANAAEMLRLACCLATERGLSVCVPVHDALLVEGPANTIDQVVNRTREAMAEASELVLNGFRLRTKATVIRWSERYMDGRGRAMWEHVMRALSVDPVPDTRPLRVIRLRRSVRV